MRMRRVALKDRLGFVTPRLKEEANRFLSTPGKKVMPHAIAVVLGITRAESLALLSVFHAEEVATIRLLLYHHCEPEVPFSSASYGQGFPRLPITCSLCEEEITSYDELGFEFEAIFPEPIELV